MRFVALMALLLALAGCKGKPSPTVKIDPGLQILVPSDTIVMAGIRLDQLRETATYKKYSQRIDRRMEEFAKRYGLDLRRDLWQVLVAFNGSDGLVLARGKFSEMGMEPRIEGEGITRSSYKGYNLIGNERLALTFMNATTAVAGPTPLVKATIDGRSEKKGGNAPAFIKRAQMIPSSNQLWIVGVGGKLPLPIPRRSNLENFGRIIESVQEFWGGADLSNGIHATGEGVCAADTDAKRLGDTMRGLIGLARLNTPDDRRDLLRVFDGVKVTYEERTVKLDADVPPDLLDALVTMAEKMGIRSGGR